MHPRILLAGMASIVAGPFGFAADAVFSSGAITGDADSGVGSAKTCTAIANVIGADVAVNSATSTGSGAQLSGTNWSPAGLPSLFPGGGNHTTTFGVADGGNDVTLQAVPEPASAAILLFDATLLTTRRQRP